MADAPLVATLVQMTARRCWSDFDASREESSDDGTTLHVMWVYDERERESRRPPDGFSVVFRDMPRWMGNDMSRCILL